MRQTRSTFSINDRGGYLNKRDNFTRAVAAILTCLAFATGATTLNAAQRFSSALQSNVPFGGGAEINSMDIERTLDPRDSMLQPLRLALGQGYSTLTRTKLGYGCVSGKFAPPETGKVDPLPGSATLRVLLLQSAEDLKREMSFEASAEVGFGRFSASASAKEQRTNESHRTTQYLVVSSRFIGPDVVVTQAVVSNEAKAQLARSPANFYRACGDEFVSTIQTGAEFFAVLTFESNDVKEFAAVEASLKIAVGTNTASATVKDAVTSATNNSRLSIDAWRIGGSGNMPKKEVNDIVEYASNFAGKITDSSQLRPIGHSTDQYTKIDLGFDPLPDTFTAARDEINPKVNRIERALTRLKGLPTDYLAQDLVMTPADTATNAALAAQLTASLKTMAAARAKCNTDPSKPENCALPAAITDYRMPSVPPRPIVTMLNIKVDGFQRVAVVPAEYPKGLRLEVAGMVEWRLGSQSTSYGVGRLPEKANGYFEFYAKTGNAPEQAIPAVSGAIVPPGILWARIMPRIGYPPVPSTGSVKVILY